MTDQTAAHPCIYCTGQSCANAGSGDRPCCPDCSGPLHHVRPDVAADIRRSAVAAEREANAGAVDELCDDVDDPFMYGTLRAVAAAIRSRGEATDV